MGGVNMKNKKLFILLLVTATLLSLLTLSVSASDTSVKVSEDYSSLTYNGDTYLLIDSNGDYFFETDEYTSDIILTDTQASEIGSVEVAFKLSAVAETSSWVTTGVVGAVTAVVAKRVFERRVPTLTREELYKGLPESVKEVAVPEVPYLLVAGITELSDVPTRATTGLVLCALREVTPVRVAVALREALLTTLAVFAVLAVVALPLDEATVRDGVFVRPVVVDALARETAPERLTVVL